MLLDKHCIGNKGMILIKGRDVIIIMRKKKKNLSARFGMNPVFQCMKLTWYRNVFKINHISATRSIQYTRAHRLKLCPYQSSQTWTFSTFKTTSIFFFFFVYRTFLQLQSHQYRIVNSIIALASYSGKKKVHLLAHTLQIRLCHINVLANDELDLLYNPRFFSLK